MLTPQMPIPRGGRPLTRDEVLLLIEEMRQPTRDRPNDVGNSPLISELLQEIGDINGAIEEANRALAIDGNCVEALSARGWANTSIDGDRAPQQALRDFEKALKLSPRNATILARMSGALYKTRDFDRAVQRATEAIGIDDCSHFAWRIRAWAFLQKNDYARALEDFDQLIRICPDDDSAHYYKGLLHFKRAEYKESLIALTGSLHLKPMNHEALMQKGKANYFLKHFEQAKQDCDAALAIHPSYYEAMIWRGNALRRLERKEEALQALNQAVEMHPDRPEAYHYRATAFQRWHQYDLALADYTKGIELEPRAIDLLSHRGSLLAKLEHFAEARADLERVLAIDPSNENAQILRAQIARQRKKVDPDHDESPRQYLFSYLRYRHLRRIPRRIRQVFFRWFCILLLFFFLANFLGVVRPSGLKPGRWMGFPFIIASWGWSDDTYFSGISLVCNALIALVASFLLACLIAYLRIKSKKANAPDPKTPLVSP